MKDNKKQPIYQCSRCGYKTNTWVKICPSCNKQYTLKENSSSPVKKSEDHFLFTVLVLIPLGILGVAWIWQRYGFIYSLLTGAIYATGTFLLFRKKY